MNHYQRHVGDYIRDTVGLSMLEEGAYTRLLDQYYATEAPLPADPARLYRMARATSKAERAAVDAVVAYFFTRTDGGYRQKRADRELEAIYNRSTAARNSAQERWNKRNANAMRTHSDGNTKPMRNGCDGNALPMLPITHYPLPITQEATHPSPSATDATQKRCAGVAKTRPHGAAPKPADAPKTADTWGAYCTAYRGRYGVDPTRNARVNGLMAQFVDRIGVAEAPPVAAFYLTSNRQLYVAATHPLDLLLRDAEALRTAWATHHHGTEAEARMADRTQATGNVFDAVRRELKNG